MHTAVQLVMDRLTTCPEYLPAGFSHDAMKTLLNFCLDNSYFEFNDKFNKQTEGGPMGSPLTVDLAEIRTSHLEQEALDTFTAESETGPTQKHSWTTSTPSPQTWNTPWSTLPPTDPSPSSTS